MDAIYSRKSICHVTIITMRFLVRCLLWIICILSFVNLLKLFVIGIYGQDFIYYYSAVRALIVGNDPYSTGYIYPPIVLLIIYPFQLFILPIARLIWTFFSLFSLCVALILLLKIYKEKLFSNTALIIYSLVFLFFPVRYTLGMGQINMYVLLVLSFALYFINKQKNGLAGIFFGLAISIKYIPFFIIPYLILRKQWRTLQFLILTVIFLFLTGFIFLDYNITVRFISDVFPSFIYMNGNDAYYNQALSGFLAREIPDDTARWMWRLILSGSIVFITFFVFYRQKIVDNKQIIFETGTVIMLSVLINSFSWQHHYTWLIIPLIILFFIARRAKYRVFFYLYLGVVYLLITYNIKVPVDASTILQSHTFYGGILLWLLSLFFILQKVYVRYLK